MYQFGGNAKIIVDFQLGDKPGAFAQLQTSMDDVGTLASVLKCLDI